MTVLLVHIAIAYYSIRINLLCKTYYSHCHFVSNIRSPYAYYVRQLKKINCYLMMEMFP